MSRPEDPLLWRTGLTDDTHTDPVYQVRRLMGGWSGKPLPIPLARVVMVVVGYGSSCSGVGYQGVGGWTAAWAFSELKSELASHDLSSRAQGSSPA